MMRLRNSAGNALLTSRRQGFFLSLGLLILFAFKLVFSCAASTNAIIEYNSRIWQTDEGLPQNGVQAIAQTRDGFIWVGTTKGLTRFDGEEFKVYDSANTPELKNSSISVLSEGRDGSLWIGTVGGGLSRFKSGKFIYYELQGPETTKSIKSIIQAKDDSIWIGTLGGAFHLRQGNWSHLGESDGLVDDMARSLCEVDQELWIGTSKGIDVLSAGSIVKEIPEFSGKLIRTILHDSAGRLWIGWMGGLVLIDHGKTFSYSKADGLPDNNVTTLCEDRRGQIWIGTYAGLGRWVDGRLLTERDHEGRYYDQVNAVMEDQEGDIWLGCRNGLQELRSKRFKTYTRQNGLSHNNIMSVLEDHTGAIWAATWGGGLSRLYNEKVTNFKDTRFNVGPMPDLVLSLMEDGPGRMLIGSDYEGGVYVLENGKVTNLWTKTIADTNRVVRVMHRDRRGDLWVGTDSGLVKNDGAEKFLDGHAVRSIVEDHKGNLFIGCNSALYRSWSNNFVLWPINGEPIHDTVVALYEDASNSVWIGTAGKGLKKYRDGRVTAYTSKDGLTSDDVFEILEDDQGWLWMSSFKGVFRVEKKNLDDFDAGRVHTIRCLAYGKGDGLESLQCNGVAKPSGWKGKDGRLWFATAQGLAVTDPKLELTPNDRPPAVVFTELVADKQEYEFPAAGRKIVQTGIVSFTVPPGRGELEFHYGALSFQAPEKNRFRYRLLGIDPDWVEVQRRAAYYNHLPPGKYTFQVMACNNDGVWSRNAAVIEVVVQPHFWQRLWFKLLLVIIGVAFAALLVRNFLRRKYKQELQRLERERAIEHERTRIARDMHDEIGAKLTKISFLGAVAKRKLSLPEEAGVQIDKMSTTARDVIRSLDEIVWALNPANDSLEDLANYLSRNATEFFDNSPISCHLDIPEELPALELGMDVRHNLVLASKEALNNVLKHSGATTVYVELAIEGNDFTVRISDNGRGFVPNYQSSARENNENVSDSGKRVGNGLHNMQNRLAAIGGTFHVKSSPGNGSTIEFRVTCLNGMGTTPPPSAGSGHGFHAHQGNAPVEST